MVTAGAAPGETNETAGSTDAASGETITAVICCNDDVGLDPMSHDLLKAGKVLIAEDDPEVMYQRACRDTTTHYAFLMDPDEERRHAKFMELYERRKALYKELAE